jgi:hypothetical protein
MSSRQPTFLIVATVCALAASSAANGYARMPADPCKLLTSAQVAAALGTPVGAAESITSDNTACKWQTPKAPRQMVTLQVLPAGKVFTGRTQPGQPQTSVSGLGDEAFYRELGAWKGLFVKKGAIAFTLKIYGVKDLDKQAAIEKQLAVDVLAKL